MEQESFILALRWLLVLLLFSIFFTERPTNIEEQFLTSMSESLPIHSYFCADPQYVWGITILSESDISYWTGTNGISPDNLLTFKGW